jgi:hypothetical protein
MQRNQLVSRDARGMKYAWGREGEGTRVLVVQLSFRASMRVVAWTRPLLPSSKWVFAATLSRDTPEGWPVNRCLKPRRFTAHQWPVEHGAL